jgi:hypothetical protein
MYSACYSGQILKKLEFSRQIFEKYPIIKFHENPSSESRAVPCRRANTQADRWIDADITKLKIAFRKFAKAPENFTTLTIKYYF